MIPLGNGNYILSKNIIRIEEFKGSYFKLKPYKKNNLLIIPKINRKEGEKFKSVIYTKPLDFVYMSIYSVKELNKELEKEKCLLF